MCNSLMTSSFRKRRDVNNDDIVVSLGPIEPASDVLVVSESNSVNYYNTYKWKDTTTTQNNFINSNNSYLGVSSKIWLVFNVRSFSY